MISDFLMEQRGRILELEEKLKHTESEDRRGLIKAQIAVYFEQGMEALARYESDTPKPVRDYFMGYRKDAPGFQELTMTGEEAPEKCPRCQSAIREIPRGVSARTGKSYKKFWVCDNPECDFTYNARKNRKGWKHRQDQNLVYISISIAIGILSVLYYFSIY